MKTHTKKWKASERQEIARLVGQYPVVGIVSLEGFPAALFQEIRKKLHGKAIVRVSKARVIAKALEESKLKDSGLKSHLNGSFGLICTKEDAFKLYNFLKKNKGQSAAKVGMLAPMDIVVPAGDTGLPPGPALSDLKAAGLSPRVQGATIFIPADTVVTKKGEQVSKAVVSVLGKLGIKPVKIGLNIIAILEKGEIFKGADMEIDEEQLLSDIQKAYSNALSLAVEAQYFVPEALKIMLQKASRQASAISSRFPAKEEAREEKAAEKQAE